MTLSFVPCARARFIAAASLCLLVAACDGSSGSSKERGEVAGGGVADCAIGPGAGWMRGCSVEREGGLLTVRHPDGAFRRFRIVGDGRGLIAADGAEQAKVAILDKGLIEVSVAQDRYRLPASVAEGAAR